MMWIRLYALRDRGRRTSTTYERAERLMFVLGGVDFPRGNEFPSFPHFFPYPPVLLFRIPAGRNILTVHACNGYGACVEVEVENAVVAKVGPNLNKDVIV